MQALTEMDDRRYLDAKNTEQYVLSVCLHSKEALAKAMNTLSNLRDFKIGTNSKAFGIIQNRFQAGKDIDPVVICDTWIDLGIYSEAEANHIRNAWDHDTKFDPKINELAKLGGIRKAKKDISTLNDEANKDTHPEQLAKMAMDCAIGWNKGSEKKYKTAFEVH